jgi:tetratricopeptide (TPR) repeat protein
MSRPTTKASSVTLSACIIAKDEQANIARAIDGVRAIAKEVLVLDTGSTDATATIAAEHGAVVRHFAWTGSFSDARNALLAEATGDWIFILDADHEATDAWRAKVLPALAKSKADALYAPLTNVHDGGATTAFHFLQFVRNGKGYRYRGRIHEEIDGAVREAGGVVGEIDLPPVLHHGYTSAEDTRKGRRARNLALLRQAVAEAPDDARSWHYLGLELLLMEEHDEARRWFERVLAERPNAPIVGWSASLLAGELRRRGDATAAWRAARRAIASADAPSLGWAQLGALAADEGDHLLADRAADELGRPQARRRGADLGDRDGLVAQLRGVARTERGEHLRAIAAFEEGARRSPNDAGLVDLYVRALERVEGSIRACRRAIRTVPSRPVAAAIVRAFVRAEDFAHALELAQKLGDTGLTRAHALLRVGQRDAGLELLRAGGEPGRVRWLLWALEGGERATLEEATLDAPASLRARADRIWRCEPIGEDDAAHAAAAAWLRLSVELRLRNAARRIARALEGGAGLLADALFASGLPHEALAVALDHPDEAAAARVIGVVAHDAGDLPTAAEFLLRGAADGRAPVRIYARGVFALRQVGRRAEATALLARGLDARPGSLLLERLAS